MADTLVNFLVENLLQLVTENVKLIAGAKGELDNLLEDVRSLNAFLSDAAVEESNSSLWKDFVRKIRIQVHKAEDVVEKFLVQAKLHEEKNAAEKVFYIFGHTKRVRNLAKDINDIREKVKEIRRDNPEALQPKRMLDQQRTVAREPQDTFLEVKQVVGFDDKAKYVIRRLIEGSEDLEFVPIVGMAGLGKTTLARKVWSDSQVTTEFSKNIWVSVGQSNELKQIFFVILKFMGGVEEFRCDDGKELAKVIREFVTEKDKCLIVLDNVWARDLVDFVKNVLPENKKGHRIMMTTRLRDVASYASEYPYDLKFLTSDESFQLLKKRVFGSGRCSDDLVKLGKSIARKCSGLPLALVVIAEALLKVHPTEYDWGKIEDNVWQHLVKENDPTSCWKIVETNYKSLSTEMKACFLYCLAFPKGYDIPAQKLIRLWIAEGLIRSSPRNTLEEIAESYLGKLEERDLVTLSREITGPIKKVKCNDMFYEFYKMEVNNERVFQELRLTPDQGLPSIRDPDISRRLHIEFSALSDFISTKPIAEHVRSFLCFSSEEQSQFSAPDNFQLILKAFPLIRVLKIEPVKIPSSKYLNQLFHLRYISISGDFKELPAFFGKFWNLQSIIINTSTPEPTLNIKANIWNLSQLRHFQTNKPAKLPLPSTQKGEGRSSLQTLSIVAPESCNKVVLRNARNLKKLSMRGRIEDFLQTNKDGFSTFEGFNCLENLKLISVDPCTSDALQLPRALFRFLLKLKKLTLSNTMFDWNDATKLGQLECLKVLKLKKDAFTGRLWNPVIGDFRELQVLWIQNDDLQRWEATRVHFPKVRKLVLKCPNLESEPAELSEFKQTS
ncbi:disease resistance protein RPP13-like isoform X1 [Nicotiana tabacum]|uniref:Disease resistance protein RPP13-like isoform X1 n=1 Tax=Nicotiana tabacum TaxID=4097 RepID=A0A1S4AB48_TOBAC|nr:PREDICTED: disease resistance protein RPP13-like isoform X1 [Nicotiana tabacum]